MPGIGELRTYISLQHKTQVPDAAGRFTVTWSTVSSVWAKKTTLRSDEAIQNMAISGSAIHNFVIRYRKDVRGDWRIKEGNRYYNIIGPPIDVNAEHRWLDIKCRESISA
jgi:SPP1 family predicted phage head-tail adaptor